MPATTMRLSQNIDVARHLAKTTAQKMYSRHLQNPNTKLVVAVGPAGCGKTLLPCSFAIEKLLNKEVSRLVITRPTVMLGENLGYLPGTMQQKMDPWMMPVFDAFKNFVSEVRLRELIKNNVVEICPLAYIRGRTFADCWVIADESQNATVGQIKTLVTRMGRDSKLVMTGDLDQCDLREKSGLLDLMHRLKHCDDDDLLQSQDMIKIQCFEDTDIMRSDLVRFMHRLYAPTDLGNPSNT
jgi:phosphate starvation-inducible PhoH-like protein